MATRLIGERIKRKEDPRFLTGRGQFVDDIEPPGCLHAAVVRARHAHARITNVDLTEAMEVPGVVAIYLHDDLGPLDRPLPLGIPNPGLHHPRTQLPLARDEVRFVGEPIALVVATSRAIAEDVADQVKVDYEPLAVVASIADAQRADALAHPDVPGNVAADLSESVGDVDRALKDAPHVIEKQLWVERGAAQPMETRGVLALFDAFEQRLTVYDSTQSPSTIRLGMAGFFKLPDQNVNVIAPDVGGGFGVKIAYWYPEELLVPFAAIALGRPVKWIEDRREHFIGSNHERGQLHDVRMGFDDDGRILAYDDSFAWECGAYVPYGVIIALGTGMFLPGPYKVPNYRYTAQVLYTNTVPCTPYRGAGQPEAVFVTERMLDAVADHLGKTKAEVRSVNVIQYSEFPYTTGTLDEAGQPMIYDSGNPPALLAKLEELLPAEEVAQAKRDAEARGKKVGYGMGVYMELTGGELYEGARVNVLPSGQVFVTTGSSTQGQGHETILAQVAAETLGVNFDDVEVITGDTRHFKWGSGTFASRIAVVAGNAVGKAAGTVRDKALLLAAEVLEAAKEDLTMEDGRVFVKGSPQSSVSLKELAVIANPLRVAYDEAALAASQFAAKPVPTLEIISEPGLEATEYFTPHHCTYASGVHGALVEVDPDTYQIKILRYAAIHDCGKMLNPDLLEGQTRGGVAQGIGGAFYEKLHYDDDGQLLNASFMDYLIPYTTEIPRIDIGHVETPSQTNPLGLKGAGEAGVIPAAATIVGAIEDALDVSISESPLSPSRLFEIVAEAGNGPRAARAEGRTR
jgi:CO/xanthine dehydrogenase Mo-binding subunit